MTNQSSEAVRVLIDEIADLNDRIDEFRQENRNLRSDIERLVGLLERARKYIEPYAYEYGGSTRELFDAITSELGKSE